MLRRFKSDAGAADWLEAPDIVDGQSRLFPRVYTAVEETGAVTRGRLGAVNSLLVRSPGAGECAQTRLSTIPTIERDRLLAMPAASHAGFEFLQNLIPVKVCLRVIF